MNALDELRVLEIGDGPAIGLAGVVLGDFGADVLRIDATPADRLVAKHRYEPLLKRSKRLHRSHLVDWTFEALRSAIAGADLVLTQGDALWHTHPELPRDLHAIGTNVHCHVTGLETEYTDCPASEPIVAAHVGRMQQFAAIHPPEAGERPVYAALQVGTHATAMSVVFGSLAALLQRLETGAGRHLVTSLERGLQPYDMGSSLVLQLSKRANDPANPSTPNTPNTKEDAAPARETRRLPRPPRGLPIVNYHPAQARDGRWLQFGNLLPHLLANFFKETNLTDATPTESPNEPTAWSEAEAEPFRDLMLARLQDRDAADWMQSFVTNGGIVAHTYQTTQAAMQDPDILDNGHVVAIDDAELGPTRQLGPIARLTETPAKPKAWTWTGATWTESNRNTNASPTDKSAQTTPPLTGCTVLEFATIIAAPLGASFLADMGARVIKVETPQGDPFRNMGNGIGAHRVNNGKESIALDLKAADARPIVMGLLAEADVVIHNFRPGVPERLGIGYEDARAANPRVVYLAANGYGAFGPGARRPSTHPIPGAALGGVLWQVGGAPDPALMDIPTLRETARRLFAANEVNPDPNTSMVIAATVLLGLWVVRRHNQGQAMQTDMFGANAWANWDDFLDYDDKPDRPSLDPGLHGLGPLHRLYACSEGWVFLQIDTELQWQRFAQLTGHDGSDQSAAGLSKTLAKQTAEHWTQTLLSAGIGCTRADDRLPGEWYANHSANMVAVEQPALGRFKRHGPQIETVGAQIDFQASPEKGADSIALALEVGCTDDQIAPLLDAGVLSG